MTLIKSLLLFSFLWLTACIEEPVNQIAVSTYKPPQRIALYWENTTEPHPERIPWTDHLIKQVTANLDKFEKGSDWPKVCPKWASMNEQQRIKTIGEFIVATIYYESAFNHKSWMTEPGMGNDPVTGKPVKSEGLLQLSYQDKQWAPWCAFDWSKDKLLKQDDPKKTIFDPYINLSCGIKIMANQISKKGLIFPKSGYWSVQNTGSKWTKSEQIKDRVLKYSPNCR